MVDYQREPPDIIAYRKKAIAEIAEWRRNPRMSDYVVSTTRIPDYAVSTAAIPNGEANSIARYMTQAWRQIYPIEEIYSVEEDEEQEFVTRTKLVWTKPILTESTYLDFDAPKTLSEPSIIDARDIDL